MDLHMRDTMLRQQRDSALFESYQMALNTHTFATQKEAVLYVLAHPAPQWFVSSEFCASVLSRWLRGKEAHYKMSKTKTRKFRALLEAYKEARQDPAYSELPLIKICEMLVERPAPEWFLGYDSALSIIAEQRKIQNDKKTRELWRETHCA